MERVNSLALLFALMAPILALRAQVPAHQPPSTPAMTAEKWREDLQHMSKQVPEMHKDLFHKMSKAEWDEAVRKLDEKIATLADHEVVVEMMRIIAKVGDGHTGVRSAPFLMAKGVYPAQFFLFEDGLYVKKAGLESINGGRVVSIDGMPADEVYQRVREITWRDNEQGAKDIGAWLLSSPLVLHALRIAKSPEKIQLAVFKNGKTVTAELKPTANFADLRNGSEALADSREASKPKPLWQKDPANNFWFEFVPETKVLYVQFNEVQDKQNETVEGFFKKVFDFAEKNPVEKLVIDLRMNGGGNNYLNLPITIGAIKSRLNERGKFFVIIGRETFSAAQNTVNDLEKYTNAVFVGEPTAASINHYGDARPVTLPNSKLQIQASTLWWQDGDPRDTRQWKAPDVAADMTFDDYRNGRDPAMEAILNYKPVKGLSEIVADARRTGDLKTFVAEYKQFKANPAHKYHDTETTLNRVGHFLLNNRREDDALLVFKLNAEENPNSGVVFQSLGDWYGFKGDKVNALQNYEKAVKLNPNLTASRDAIKNLKAN